MTAEEARQEALDALSKAKAFMVEDMPDRAQAQATIGLAYAALVGSLPEDLDEGVDAAIASLRSDTLHE